MKKSIRAAFMDAALKQGKGSTRTRIERQQTFVRFEEFSKANRFHQVSPETLTRKQLMQFVDAVRPDVSQRTLQNLLAHFRVALRGVGRGHVADAPEWANKQFNAASHAGDRVGKHRAVSNAELGEAQRQATALGAAGREVVVLTELQRSFGLRAQEAVQCSGSLQGWKAALTDGRPVLIASGTKGGRARTAMIPESLRPRAIAAVDAALALSSANGGRVVAADGLKAAMDRYAHACRAVGLRGEIASHSLRYAWAHDRFREYLGAGYERRDALARLSQDLGHGDGRARYVKMVYLRGIEE